MKPLPLPFVPLRLGSDAVSVKSLRCHICSVWPRCSPIFYCHEREVTRVFEIFENSLSQKLKLCIWAGSKSRVQSILVVRGVRFVAHRVRFFVVCGVRFLRARHHRALPAGERRSNLPAGSGDHICPWGAKNKKDAPKGALHANKFPRRGAPHLRRQCA